MAASPFKPVERSPNQNSVTDSDSAVQTSPTKTSSQKSPKAVANSTGVSSPHKYKNQPDSNFVTHNHLNHATPIIRKAVKAAQQTNQLDDNEELGDTMVSLTTDMCLYLNIVHLLFTPK